MKFISRSIAESPEILLAPLDASLVINNKLCCVLALSELPSLLYAFSISDAASNEEIRWHTFRVFSSAGI